jgi:hypothetical protein
MDGVAGRARRPTSRSDREIESGRRLSRLKIKEDYGNNGTGGKNLKGKFPPVPLFPFVP